MTSPYPEPKPGIGLSTIAFDLDGVLAEPTYPAPGIGSPVALGLRALRHYAAAGFEIIVFTSRPASHAAEIWAWLEEHDLADLIYDLLTDKPRYAMFVDDRAAKFPEEFLESKSESPTR